MAKVLKLNWGSVDVNLVSGTALDVMTWTPQVATPLANRMPEPVTESLTLRVIGSSHDVLANNLQSLHNMQKWAESYITDRSGTTPVWLHAKMTNETGERRALVRKIDASFISPWYGPSADANPTTMLSLAIEREPYWERIAEITGGSTEHTAAAAIVSDYTTSAGDIPGDVGARIGYMAVTGGSVSPIGRVWGGLRSASKHGNVANFVPIWELEDTDATLGTNAARATDTTASPGGTANTKVTITPAVSPVVTAWASRLTISLDHVTANPTDNYGKFLWLLRQKITEGTWEIQLRHGFIAMGSADLVQGPIVQVTNTDWDYTELGVASLPSVDPWRSASAPVVYYNDSAVHVFARRTAGTGVLDLDCLCPIPIDEGFFKAGPFNPSAGNYPVLYVYNSPRGIATYAIASGYRNVPYTEQDFTLPPGDGRLIAVYARDTTSVLTDTAEFYIKDIFSRYASLRGSV